MEPRKRTVRTVPDGAVLTMANIRKLPRRSQGPKKNPASKLKFALKKYINRCPYASLTPNTKRVAELIIDWYRPGHRRSWASRATLATELAVAQSTVSEAIATLHKENMIFTKTGGFGANANEYVPNFHLVINPDTGEIIKNARYEDFTLFVDFTSDFTGGK